MKIGYTRVSSTHQNLDRQIDSLQREECDRIFSDKFTGKTMSRPGWEQCWDFIREGDTLIVDSVLRIGRTFEEMILLVGKIGDRGIKLKSLSEPMMDTSTASGELIFRIMAAVAEWQHAYILETAAEGRAAAKARGRSGGRPRKLDKTAIETALTLVEADKPVKFICNSVNVSRSTYYRRIKVLRENSIVESPRTS